MKKRKLIDRNALKKLDAEKRLQYIAEAFDGYLSDELPSATAWEDLCSTVHLLAGTFNAKREAKAFSEKVYRIERLGSGLLDIAARLDAELSDF